MALFGRRTRVQPGLLTCIVSCKADLWEAFWIGDGRNEPPEFKAASLTEATLQAVPLALSPYAGGPVPLGGELQFAIYPWDYGKNGAIYDISGSAGQFTARDIQGSDREIAGASLEDLIEGLRQEPAGDRAMLRWIRQLADVVGEFQG